MKYAFIALLLAVAAWGQSVTYNYVHDKKFSIQPQYKNGDNPPIPHYEKFKNSYGEEVPTLICPEGWWPDSTVMSTMPPANIKNWIRTPLDMYPPPPYKKDPDRERRWGDDMCTYSKEITNCLTKRT